MCEYAQIYPEYNLAQHKGYPTQAHQAAVFKHGPSSIHRLTFNPTKRIMEGIRKGSDPTKYQAQLAAKIPTLKSFPH
jgi:ribonuclease HII